MELTPTELARRAFDLWASRDREALAAVYAPECIYDCTERILNPETYFGYDGLLQLTDEIDAIWETFDITVEELVTVGDDRVIALMTSNARGRVSGIGLVDSKAATIFTARAGRIVHAKLYPERRDAFREAGIPHGETE